MSLQTDSDLLSADLIQWADGFMLVYSILDRLSFEYIQRFKGHVNDLRNGMAASKEAPAHVGVNPVPCVLLANKADMVHLRQVTTDEGISLHTISISFSN